VPLNIFNILVTFSYICINCNFLVARVVSYAQVSYRFWLGRLYPVVILLYRNLRVRIGIFFFEINLSLDIYRPDIVNILTFTIEISKSAMLLLMVKGKGTFLVPNL
jgi:hypothetical protein